MTYEIHTCDCLELQTEPVDLIYLDPPYAHEKEDAYYGVGKTLDDYLSYMQLRLQHLKSLCKPSFNFLLHVDWKAVYPLKMMCDEIFGRDNFRNEIIWSYANPSNCKRYLPRKHNNILWYGTGKYVYNIQRIPYAGNLRVGGSTSWSGKKLDKQEYIKRGKSLTDVWTDIPALCRNESEKLGYATQKPIKLLERIVTMFSNPGQRVLDPFMGSGTTLEAAIKHDRVAIGCDANETAVALARGRLEAACLK